MDSDEYSPLRDSPQAPLPINVLIHIALLDIPTYRAMLAIPAFARYLILLENQKKIHNILSVEKSLGKYGVRIWKLKKSPYRDEDQEIECYGEHLQLYKSNGGLHREDGSAYHRIDGRNEWCLRGAAHREGAPAINRHCSDKYKSSLSSATEYEFALRYEKKHGIKYSWYLYGELHREDGPALEHPNGTGYWYLHGQYLRYDGINKNFKWKYILDKDIINRTN